MKINHLLALTCLLPLSVVANTLEHTSALEFQQTTNTRIMVEENHLRFFTGGAERMTIDGSGKVGIGHSSPQLQLHLKDPSGGAALGIERGGKLWRFDVAYNGASRLFIGHSDNGGVLNLTDQGNVGIGFTDPQSKLQIYGGNEDALIWPLTVSNTKNDPSVTDYGVGLKLRLSGNHENKWSGVAALQGSSWANNSDLALYANESEKVRIKSSGYVGIGTTSPSYKLHVNGEAYATKFHAPSNAAWPDYVFEDSYELNELNQVEKYIEENHHLPEIPSAAEVAANGVDIVDMQAKLLQKIEELTLYVIEQQKEIEKLKSQINQN